MDLFIIIAAVLGVGGIVTAAAYGLVSSGASSSSVQVVESSLAGAPSSGAGTFTITLTIKDVGTSPVVLSATNPINVTITGVKGVTGTSSCTHSGSLSWMCAHYSSANSMIDWAVTSGTVAAGEQVSLIGTVTTPTTNPVVSGTTYTVNVLLGTASASVKLTAQ